MSETGLLGPTSAQASYLKIANAIEKAMIAESARWGDYRRDVHPYNSEPYELYTLNDHWLKEQNHLLQDYFPERSRIVLNQLKAIHLSGNVLVNNHEQYGIYPNPFEVYTHIYFHTQASERVRISIYSPDGRLHKVIYESETEPGEHDFIYKPADLAPGVYVYSIEGTSFVKTGKMVLKN